MQPSAISWDAAGHAPPSLPVRFRVGLYIYALLFALLIALPLVGNVTGLGHAPGSTDFIAFHTAAELAQRGDLALAYDTANLEPLQRARFPDIERFIPYYYPPSYMLFLGWTARLPLHPAEMLFLAVTFGLFLAAIRPYLTDRHDLLILLAAPGVWITFGHGQNTYLTTALALAAGHWMDRRQVAAGVALGLLTIKPHLGLLWPVLLLLRRRWTAIGVAGAVALLLVALSAALYGPETWTAFLRSGLSNVHDNLSRGDLPIAMAASPYATAILLGLPEWVAMAAHAAGAALVIAGLAHLVRRRTPTRFVLAVLFAGALIVSPHNFAYDWTLVLAGLLIVWQRGRAAGFLRLERAGLVIGYLAPIVIGLARSQNLPIACPLLVLVLLVILRRARHEAGPAAPAG